MVQLLEEFLVCKLGGVDHEFGKRVEIVLVFVGLDKVEKKAVRFRIHVKKFLAFGSYEHLAVAGVGGLLLLLLVAGVLLLQGLGQG